MTTLFHIAARAEWDAAEDAYRPSAFAVDGFVHCSTAEQLEAVATRFYRGRTDLVLLHLDPARIAAEIRFDHADGDRYPHVYGPIERSAVMRVTPLAPEPDGTFAIAASLAEND